MPFVLKDYQQRCRDELASYLRRVSALGRADSAFTDQTNRPYQAVKALPGLPYVCVRVPTGGGKTVLAAYAVGIATKELLRAERCIVLWLAPTTQIVDQTLKALRDKRHPYRQALDADFSGCVTVVDLGAALSLQPGTLESDTVVIVSTLAALRVENTEGRKVYEANGQLMACFSGLSAEQYAILKAPVEGFDGTAPSLANLLRLRRPVVIVDEAHNARTELSFDTLARLNPSCILEFTATPDQQKNPSNVLTHVSAAELKAEQMIKLPIRLKTRPQWTEAVSAALEKRTELERLAGEEQGATGEYIRPIILFQAQRKDQNEPTITYDVLKQSLMGEFKIPEEQIAVATGGSNDLETRDVGKHTDPTRYVITVDKLREGWDCPFAYVLCSVANLSSRTAVEQILGRILRLPNASKKTHDELNHAYAFVTSDRFVAAANALTEALVESGFERFEAKLLIKAEPQSEFEYGPLFSEPVREIVSVAPLAGAIPQELKEKIQIRPAGEVVELIYTGDPITVRQESVLKAAFVRPEDQQAVQRLCRKTRGEDSWPAAMGEQLSVPALALLVDGQLQLFEEQFKETNWSLAECDAQLSESDFSIQSGPVQAADVDVSKEGRIEYRFVEELERQLSLQDIHGPKTEPELAAWLDREIDHPDVTQTQAAIFLRRMIAGLISGRGYALEQLVSKRFKLRDATARRIDEFRKKAETRAYQRMLLPNSEMPLEVSPALCFTFPLNEYPAPRLYDGPAKFRKHYYQVPADMNGEEADCAALLDSLPQVKYWVRNLTRDRFSFWLQTSTDKFYPDFIALLNDGRYLVVEYKGERDRDSPDVIEKNHIGEHWEALSGGRCIFRLVFKADVESELIRAAKSK